MSEISENIPLYKRETIEDTAPVHRLADKIRSKALMGGGKYNLEDVEFIRTACSHKGMPVYIAVFFLESILADPTYTNNPQVKDSIENLKVKIRAMEKKYEKLRKELETLKNKP
jgi:hypothetical protein